MADLLVEGEIWTGDPLRPGAEAVLLRDGKIARVGSRAHCRAAAAGTAVVRAGFAVPGLADAHGHVVLLGRARSELSCAGAASEAECAARVAERARGTPQGRWIRGGGWDQNRWPGAAFPGEASLTRAAPDHPVVLARVDRHASWVNAAALAAAGIGPGTPDPPGGRILRGPDGRPGGVLVDAAQDLVHSRMPGPTAAEIEEALLLGLSALARLGIASVHDAGVPPDVLAVYRRLAAEDRLPVRVYAMLDGEAPLAALGAQMAARKETPGLGRLDVRAVKLFADGALGSRGAALLEDYADEPGNRGLLLAPAEVLREKVRAAVAAGFQPCVHAIGDRAVAAVLDALEDAGDPAAVRALRPRIEHLQVVRPRQVARLVRIGAVASMQPAHAAADAPWVADRLGADSERLRGAYAWRTVLRAGVPLAFGSDFPVEDADPRLGLAAAETRLPEGGGPAFLPEERLGRDEALRAFTAGAAYAAFAEDRRGIVREGADADLTLFEAPPGEEPGAVRALRVTATIVGGRVEYYSSVA